VPAKGKAIMNKRGHIKQKGFSLVEMASALVIISVIAGSALSVAVNQDDSIKATQTRMKMDAIEKALSSFVKINKRLPCPADGSLALSHASFGLERKAAAVCDDTSPYYGGAGGIVGGVVPIRSLGLPDEFMMDGWGRRMAYVVNGFMARDVTQAVNIINVTGANESHIDIMGADGAVKTTDAAYALISHGVNGYGAWLRNGASQIFLTGMSAHELENNHLTAAATITAYDGEFMQKYQTEDFDDIVRFKTRKHLLHDAGAISLGAVCESAANEINNTTSNCSGAVNADACRTMAIVVSDMCL
jgi:prepilin-type N-terminal cleavage/methylation domain-containing protein